MADIKQVKELVGKSSVLTVQDFFVEKRDLIAQALPNTITPDRLIGVFTMLLKSSPGLMECSQTSLVAAVIQTVQLGLTPGNIGHCHYVPFNNKQRDGTFRREVQFIVGFKGIVELVNRSGEATILNAECVYNNDQFEYEQGLTPKLRHVPTEGERGDFKGVYCIAKNMLANEKVFVFVPAKEVHKIRDIALSKIKNDDAKKYSPWMAWPDEMAKKTSVKRVSKLLPLSVEVQKRIAADETIKTQIDRNMVDMPNQADYEEAETKPATEWEREDLAEEKAMMDSKS